jgi:hypothetical protein
VSFFLHLCTRIYPPLLMGCKEKNAIAQRIMLILRWSWARKKQALWITMPAPQKVGCMLLTDALDLVYTHKELLLTAQQCPSLIHSLYWQTPVVREVFFFTSIHRRWSTQMDLKLIVNLLTDDEIFLLQFSDYVCNSINRKAVLQTWNFPLEWGIRVMVT